MTREPRYDVAVLGAGPAGCAAARLLSAWGRRVVLFDRGDAARHELGESLPPSCFGVLEAIGVRDAVERAGFIVSTGNTVWWGDGQRRVEPFAQGRSGLQVERRALDSVLRQAAVQGGAELQIPATVLSVERRPGEPHLIVVEEAGEVRRYESSWVIDCTGRSTLLGRERRQGVSSADGVVRTLALAGIWHREPRWDVPDESHTLVESVAHGWGWSIPLAPGRRYFAAMVDPTSARDGGGDVAARHARALDRLPRLGALARSGRFEGRAWAIDASPYRVEQAIGERLLLAGDASCFIDPLSSFGVKKALTSGWMAAVVANTALTDSAMTTTAQRFFAAREREYADSAERELAALARDALPTNDAGFWRSRAGLAEHAAQPPDDDVIEPTRVAAAFERLKGIEVARLELAPDVGVVERPVVRGMTLVLEPHLAAPAFPHPLRYARGVDLLAVVRGATHLDDVGTMYARYEASAGHVPLPDYLWALSMLIAAEVLRLA